MKKLITITILLATVSGFAVTVAPIGPEFPVAATPVQITGGTNWVKILASSSNPVPVSLNDDAYDTVFGQGVALGFFMGGIAFVFRLVRQVGRQNPEI